MANVASGKRTLIDKANTTIVVTVSVAVFLVAFSAVAAKTLISQANYQNRVISAKRGALNQLKDDVTAVKTLKQSYQAFVSTSQNALGGNPQGTGQQDGNNAQIVLDALPSSYDFPSLTTSLEVLLAGQGAKINSITGTDDEVAQSANQSSTTPQPVAMPFNVSVSSGYASIQNVIGSFERSIRPIQVTKLNLSGDNTNLTLSVDAQTYYQPAKSLNIKSEIVK